MSLERPAWFVFALLAGALHAMPAPPADRFQVRSYVNSACIVADEPFFVPDSVAAGATGQPKFFSLLGWVVVGRRAELFVNQQTQAAADAQRARRERKDTRYAVLTRINLYRAEFDPEPALNLNNAKLGCMTIVAAMFQPDSTDCKANYQPKEIARETISLPEGRWKSSRADDSIENQLRRANVCVEGKARAVYEARFEVSIDGTAYRLKDAGYQIASLLTTQEKGATRTAFYTLKLSAQSPIEQRGLLSSAWVNLGTVSAGTHSTGSAADSAWLKIPALSIEARRVYETKTEIYQRITGEIDALKRAITRNRRALVSLDQHIAAASADVARGLRENRRRTEGELQSQSDCLNARKAEYAKLPRTPLEFMPVTIEVAITEAQSEKKAQGALTEMFGAGAEPPAPAQAAAPPDTTSRALPAGDVITDEGDTADPGAALDRARAAYFDAWVAAQTSSEPRSGQDRLATAKAVYNGARASMGLEPVR
jgi:hypothetical protein